MLIANLQNLFEREIDKVIDELQSYKNQDQIWAINGTVSNSAGNICLHFVGNLNTFIGTGLAKIDYIRDRPLEFSA